MGWADAFKKGGDTAKINFRDNANSNAAKNFGDAFKEIGKNMSEDKAYEDKKQLRDMQIQNEQNKLDEYAKTTKQKNFDDAYTNDTLNFSKKEWEDTNKIAKADTGQSLESLYGASAPTVANQDKTFRTNETNRQLDIDKAYGDYVYGKSKKQLENIAAGDNSRKIGIEALKNENDLKNAWTYDADANKIPNPELLKNEQEIKNLRDAFSPLNTLTPSIAAQEQQKAREQAQTNLELTAANNQAKANYVKLTNPKLADIGGDGSTLMDINKDDKDTKVKTLELTAKEKDIKHATMEQYLRGQLSKEELKVIEARIDKANQTGKLLTLPDQVTVAKLFDNDFYKLDDKGKVTITKEGSKELKDGVSPEQLKFVKQGITQYMSAPGSDKNYEAARDKYVQAWAETPRAKLEAKVKQINDNSHWWNSTVTPEEVVKREQKQQSEQVLSEDNSVTKNIAKQSTVPDKFISDKDRMKSLQNKLGM